MLVKFEQNRMVETTRNYELFGNKKIQNKTKNKQTNKQKQKNSRFFKTIFDNALTPFWKTFLWLKKFV